MSKVAHKRAQEIQRRLIEETEPNMVVTTDSDSYGTITATRVDPRSKIEVNYTKLNKRLSGRQWKSIVSESVDHAKLEAEIARGNIPIDVVNDCVTYVPREPYFKVEATHDFVAEEGEQIA